MQQSRHYKYLNILIIGFITCYLTSEVILNRLISIGPGFITGGTFIYFLSPIFADVITEVYGYKITRQVLWCSILAWLFLGASIQICLKLPSPAFWHSNAEAYQTALGSLFRSCLVSSIAVLAGQMFNAYAISKWKILFRGKYFWLRSTSSSIIGDTITVTLSILGIFTGRIPTGSLSHTLLPELIIMVLFSALGAIPASFLASFLKKSEKIDTFDTNVNFNPFRINIEDESEPEYQKSNIL